MTQRVIEFRAWDEGNKVMHYNFQFIKSGEEGNDWVVFTSDKQKLSDKPHPLENPYFQQQFKIMQFTGLYDSTKFSDLSIGQKESWLKNNTESEWKGNKIFEGDIMSNCMASPLISVVKWNKDKALFQAVSEHRVHWLFSSNALFKIIGNVFDNPELLGDL